MPKRMSRSKRQRIYRLLVERDGMYCATCSRKGPLEIHHVNGDPKDSSLKNLALLCRSCNARDGARRQQMRCDPEGEGGRGRESESYARRRELGFEDGEASHRSNLEYEPKWKAQVRQWCLELGHISGSEAVDGMAEAVDCSTQTTERYWRKATSHMGWLERRTDLMSYPVWALRDLPSNGQGEAER